MPAVGFAEGVFDEVVAVELRDGKKGATRDVEAGVSEGLLVRLQCNWDEKAKLTRWYKQKTESNRSGKSAEP